MRNYLDSTERPSTSRTPPDYTVGVCGERVSFERERYAFERRLKRVRLRWIKNPQWKQADFFIAPTHLSCDRIIDGKIIATISRLGVPIGYVKDRRAIIQAALTPPKAAKASLSTDSTPGTP